MAHLWGLLIISHALIAGLPLLAVATNYEKQALSVSYGNETGLPTFGTLNGTVTELDYIPPTITLNKTDAALNCSSGFMNIQLTFKQDFFGIVYADFDRNSACKVTGNGKRSETIQLPLKGCGTVQSPARVFTNNIIIRFHPGLEIDGDEVITVVCRYPPPTVVVPPAPLPIIDAPPEVRTLQPLREFEILFIICAIIFLALMLLGIGCSYYCLKKRNIRVVRRRPVSTLGSDVTKISEPPSMFVGLKIPRAQAQDASGSEDITESIKTDFPSDIASLESEEEYTSAYSDKMCILTEGAIVSTLREPPMPDFDINMVVKEGDRVFTPVPSTATSDTETVLNAQEQYLTTILERTETNTLETLERIRKAQAKAGPPPVHARLNIKNKQVSDASDLESESEYSKAGTEFSEQELELESRQMRNFALDEGEFTRNQEESQFSQFYQDQRESVYEAHTNQGYQAEHGETRYRSDLIQPIIRSTRGGDMTGNQSNFDVLIRIINSNVSESYIQDDTDDASSVFTVEERMAIKKVLEEDVTLQSELKRTFTREDFQVLQRNQLIQEIVEPRKWDVLIRILNRDQGSLVRDSKPDDESSRASESQLSANVMRYGRDGGTYEVHSMATSGRSSHIQHDALSAADRSGTEITEYHHYSSNQVYEWDEDNTKY